MRTLLKISKTKIIAILFIGLLALGVLQVWPNNSASNRVHIYASGPPLLPESSIPPASVDETKDAELMTQKAEELAKSNLGNNLSGPETRGALITIVGKQVSCRMMSR